MDSGYIVSMTTYYPRFCDAHLAIESVLAQKCSFKYEVHLYLAQADIAKNNGAIPSNIKAWEEKGLKIIIKKEDLLVYNKYVHAMRENPDKTIITVDDDILYPDYLLAKLIQTSQEFPGNIVCFRGHFLSFDKQGSLKPYNTMMDRRVDNVKRMIPSFCLLPTGVSGVLYPPQSLDDIALDKSLFASLSPRADDIWLKMASLKKGTHCVQIEKRNVHFPVIANTQKIGLLQTNVLCDENDRQLDACFSKYPELLEKVRNDATKLNATHKPPYKDVFFDALTIVKRKMRVLHKYVFKHLKIKI
jgi:hypothetical protein